MNKILFSRHIRINPNEVYKVKGRNVEVNFKKGLNQKEFFKWLEDNKLVDKKKSK